MERIATDSKRAMRRHGTLISHLLISSLAMFIVALLLEVFVFNFNYWTSLNNDEIDITDQISLSRNASGSYLLTADDCVMEFSSLDTHIDNVRVEFAPQQSPKNPSLKIQFTDAAHATYFDSTEYTAGVPLRKVVTNDERGAYVKLNTVGVSNNLRIEVVGDNLRFPIAVDHVYLNSVYPFNFVSWRFLGAFLVMFLMYLFRPSSKIYSIYIATHTRLSKACVMVFLALEVFLVSSFLFMGSNLVGVATSSYNWGSWDGHSLVNTYEVAGSNAQQYSYLAEALADGHLYLDEEPPQWLVEMDNPYDKGAREELQKATGESYLWDVVYYDGHYYVYFGVVPVILFYLPFYLIAQGCFPTAIGVLICAIMFMIGCTFLLDRFARYHFDRVSLGLYLLLQLPLIFCSGVLYLVKHPTFYSLPIMMALTFSVWGLYLWMRGRSSKRPYPCYVAGSLCMALVAGCRPQLIILSCVAFPLFWKRYITEGRIRTKKGIVEFICLIVPYLIVAALIMWYNYARFGSPFDFGSNYNLTTNDMTQRGFDIGRLCPAIFAYFIQTPSMQGTFPFIQPCPFDTTYMGQTIKEVTFGGLLACAPILWVLILSARAVRLRVRTRKNRTVAGVLCVLIASAIIVALADAEMAGILQRYFADFSFFLLLASVLVIFIFNENANHSSGAYYLAVHALPVLVGIGILYQLCLCFVPETGWYSSVYPWAYQSIVHAFQFWT